MKSRRGFVLIGGLLALGLATMAQPADARSNVDINLFVDALSPYGDWFDYPGYGAAWRPSHVGRGWRPYTDGRWVWSDDDGWVWAENEAWGWAPYHYGRWLYDGRMGWVWIPGNEWAPAWVDWRRGPNYVGWLPLPPAGISIVSILPAQWIFVSQRHFFNRRLHNVVFVPDHRIFRECREEIRMSHNHGRWFNRGADRHQIERVARVQAPIVRVRDVDRPDRARFGSDRDGGGEELHVYRPNVREARVNRTLPPVDRMERLSPTTESATAARNRNRMESRERTADQRSEREIERRTPQQQEQKLERPREADRRARVGRPEQQEASQQSPLPTARNRGVDRREVTRPPQQSAPRNRDEDRRSAARHSVAPPPPAAVQQPQERVRDRSHDRYQRPARVAAEQPKQSRAPQHVQTQQNRQEKARGGPQRAQKHGPGEPEQAVPGAPVQPGGPPNRR